MSSEAKTDKSNEWDDIEIDNNNRDSENSQDKTNTYYNVDNEADSGEELVPIDLSNDITINQMLADQGAAYDPDAEVFDIHQYQLNAQHSAQTETSHQQPSSQQQEVFDYLPYHHQETNEKRPSIIK